MRFSGLDHVGFAVTNLDRSVPFYNLLLGDEPLLREVWNVEYVGAIVGYPDVVIESALWRLAGGDVLELCQYHQPLPAQVDMATYNAGNAHLCLVSDGIVADYERMGAIGAEFRSPGPIEILWGPYRGGRTCCLRDPDGITIELVELPPGGPRFEASEPVAAA